MKEKWTSLLVLNSLPLTLALKLQDSHCPYHLYVKCIAPVVSSCACSWEIEKCKSTTTKRSCQVTTCQSWGTLGLLSPTWGSSPWWRPWGPFLFPCRFNTNPLVVSERSFYFVITILRVSYFSDGTAESLALGSVPSLLAHHRASLVPHQDLPPQNHRASLVPQDLVKTKSNSSTILKSSCVSTAQSSTSIQTKCTSASPKAKDGQPPLILTPPAPPDLPPPVLPQVPKTPSLPKPEHQLVNNSDFITVWPSDQSDSMQSAWAARTIFRDFLNVWYPSRTVTKNIFSVFDLVFPHLL